jgi:hypothetical protein
METSSNRTTAESASFAPEASGFLDMETEIGDLDGGVLERPIRLS